MLTHAIGSHAGLPTSFSLALHCTPLSSCQGITHSMHVQDMLSNHDSIGTVQQTSDEANSIGHDGAA